MIPGDAIVNWEDLGVELDIKHTNLERIKQDVTPKDVVVKCKAILQAWIQQCCNPDTLIKALNDCQLNAYAKVVEEGQFIVCTHNSKYILTS